MNGNDIKAIKTLLASPKNIVIIPHRNPDGDAIGSSLALYHYLNQYQHHVSVIAPNDYPAFLKWMPGEEEIIRFDAHQEYARQKIKDAAIIFTLDFNALNRVEDMKPDLEASGAVFIMIDHHQEPDDYAVYTYSQPGMSSTCEMIYNFIAFLDNPGRITPEIATCIYTGIMTDTGSFRFPTTTSTTHRIIADLIDSGAQHSEIHNAIFDTNSPDKFRLLGCALKNVVVIEDANTAYITLSRRELERYDYKKGDTEGFVNYGLALKGIKFAAIFIQKPRENHIRISLRSKGDFPVNEIAKVYFSGGGHINAAGGKSNLSLEETVEKFKAIVAHYKNRIQ